MTTDIFTIAPGELINGLLNKTDKPIVITALLTDRGELIKYQRDGQDLEGYDLISNRCGTNYNTYNLR